MLGAGRFGTAGARVVIEELLTGEEASFIVMADGEQCLPLASSQHHKARDDGDRGPNTGGMGAYSPAPVVTPEIHERVMEQVIRPTLRGLAAEGLPYRGFLYAGLMIGSDGTPRVLEYNCRLGDPETQPILMRLQSDLVELCLAALGGRLNQARAQWDPRVALGVVMAAGGYPDAYDKDHPISGLAGLDAPDLKVFHAGTRLEGDRILTAGGRVLCVTALGETAQAAQDRAYTATRQIRWQDAYCRTDIGYRAIAREQAGR
jgi:phosphoribosylamine--glycine ligase